MFIGCVGLLTVGAPLPPHTGRMESRLTEWNSDTWATADSKFRRSPTATGSPTDRRWRTTSPRLRAGRAGCRHHHLRHGGRLCQHRGGRSARRGAEGAAPESLEIFTKVYFPTGPKGHNDTGLCRKHIMESIDGSLRRLQTDYVDLYQAHRFDVRDPAGGDDAGVRRRGPGRQSPLHRGQRVDCRPAAGRARAGQGAGHPPDLEPAAVLHAVAGDRGRGRAGFGGAGHLADRLVPRGAGRADRQVPPGRAAAGGQPRHRRARAARR